MTPKFSLARSCLTAWIVPVSMTCLFQKKQRSSDHVLRTKALNQLDLPQHVCGDQNWSLAFAVSQLVRHAKVAIQDS